MISLLRPLKAYRPRAPRSGVLPGTQSQEGLRPNRPVRESATLAEILEPSRNSLNALRLLFAAAVVVSHAWWLGGYGPEPALFGIKLGTAGVIGFFAVSGYLVTLSAERSTSLSSYALARFVRIYPGLIVASLIVTFIAAPLCSLVTGGRWDMTGALEFIGSALVLLGGISNSPSIGTSLRGNYDFLQWDGPLWTLTWEVLCYTFVAFVVFMLRRGAAEQHAPRVTIFLLVGITALATTPIAGSNFESDRTSFIMSFIVIFLAGSLLAHYRERVRVELLPAVLAAALAFAFLVTGLGVALAALPLCYLILAVGSFQSPVRLRHDVSYGIYIYGWPIQQLLAALHLPAVLPPLGYAAVALIAVWPVALLSSIFVEEPAQRWRRSRQRRRRAQVELATAH